MAGHSQGGSRPHKARRKKGWQKLAGFARKDKKQSAKKGAKK